jgi:hypothetical protein
MTQQQQQQQQQHRQQMKHKQQSHLRMKHLHQQLASMGTLVPQTRSSLMMQLPQHKQQ